MATQQTRVKGTAPKAPGPTPKRPSRWARLLEAVGSAIGSNWRIGGNR